MPIIQGKILEGLRLHTDGRIVSSAGAVGPKGPLGARVTTVGIY